MTDKERLEEIKKNVIVDKVYFKYLNNDKGYWGKSYTLIEEDMKWFVEQAERVQEIDEQLYAMGESYRQERQYNEKLEAENKRYREAINEAMECLEERFTTKGTAHMILEDAVLEIEALEGEE